MWNPTDTQGQDLKHISTRVPIKKILHNIMYKAIHTTAMVCFYTQYTVMYKIKGPLSQLYKLALYMIDDCLERPKITVTAL